MDQSPGASGRVSAERACAVCGDLRRGAAGLAWPGGGAGAGVPGEGGVRGAGATFGKDSGLRERKGSAGKRSGGLPGQTGSLERRGCSGQM